MVRALPLVLLIALGGCSKVATATRPATEAAGEILLSPEDEKRLGDQLAAEVEKQERPLRDEQTQAFVEEIGRRALGKVPTEQRRFEYRFLVLDEPETVNAFAIPGGHIYVFSGLIRAAGSEAELASVLAHEIAHVVAGHPSQQLAAQLGLAALMELVFGKNPGLLSQIAGQIAAQGYLAANSRESETEADLLGVRYLAAAGWDARAMPAFFEKIDGMSRAGSSPVQTFFDTHPDPGDRAAQLEKVIASEQLGGGQESVLGSFPETRARLGGPLGEGQPPPER
jgi:predicted Zn-dependent protease